MLLDLSLAQIAWIEFGIFTAYVIRGMSGFGAGLITAPMLAFVLPLHIVIPSTALLVFVLFLVLSVRDRHHVVWEELKVLVLPTLAGVASGLLLFRALDNRLLVLLLGGFLVLYAIYMIAVNAFGLPEFRCSKRWALPLGFMGAFIDTMFGGGGGALVVIYMHARNVGRAEFRATLAMLWFLEMFTRIGGYAYEGYYTRNVLMLVLAMVPPMWLGTLVGERLGNRVSPATFSRILAVLLLVSGVSLIFK